MKTIQQARTLRSIDRILDYIDKTGANIDMAAFESFLDNELNKLVIDTHYPSEDEAEEMLEYYEKTNA